LLISVVKQSLIKGSIVSSKPYPGNCYKMCILNPPAQSESNFVMTPLHMVFRAQFQWDLQRLCTSQH